MSKKKEFDDSMANELRDIEAIINLISTQNQYISVLEERKMEIKANRLLIQSSSEDEVEEVFGKVLPNQKHDEQQFAGLRTNLERIPVLMNHAVYSTSGTTSTYQELSATVSGGGFSPIRSAPVLQAYREVAQYKSRKVEIPKGLNQLQPDLGRLFSVVHESVEKARNRVISVKQAVSDMRDVLNQIWGNLVSVAAKKCPGQFRSSSKREFKTEANHEAVAECLISDPLNRGKFAHLLDNMYKLYTEMSQTEIGKNPLNEDYEMLEDFYSRWIIQIDGAVGMINWSEWED